MRTFFRYVARSWNVSSSESLPKFILLRLTDPKFSDKLPSRTLQRMVRKREDPDGVISKWRASRFFSALKLFWCVRKDSCESSQRGLVVTPNRRGIAVGLMHAQPASDSDAILAASQTDCGLPVTASEVSDAHKRLAEHQTRFNKTPRTRM